MFLSRSFALPPSCGLSTWASDYILTMGFGDLKTPAGLKVLNDFLADKSYIEG